LLNVDIPGKLQITANNTQQSTLSCKELIKYELIKISVRKNNLSLSNMHTIYGH